MENRLFILENRNDLNHGSAEVHAEDGGAYEDEVAAPAHSPAHFFVEAAEKIPDFEGI
jgi:hypothetical protein